MKGTLTIDSLLRNLKKSSPTILTCMGAIGVVATSVMTAKATIKAIRIIEDNPNHEREPSKKEIVQLTWQCYIPATILGLTTISCIFGANVLNKRKQESLVSAYAVLNQYYHQYKKATKSVYGEDADSKIKAEIAKDVYVSSGGRYLYASDMDPESEKILCYDLYSRRYFMATMASVVNAQYHINRNLSLRWDANVNEFYDFLGIDPIEGGDDLGWSIEEFMENGIEWLDFENRIIEMEDGMRCCVISPIWDPDLL